MLKGFIKNVAFCFDEIIAKPDFLSGFRALVVSEGINIATEK